MVRVGPSVLRLGADLLRGREKRSAHSGGTAARTRQARWGHPRPGGTWILANAPPLGGVPRGSCHPTSHAGCPDGCPRASPSPFQPRRGLTFSCKRSSMAARCASRFSLLDSIFCASFSLAILMKLLFSSMAFWMTSRSCSRFSARCFSSSASWYCGGQRGHRGRGHHGHHGHHGDHKDHRDHGFLPSPMPPPPPNSAMSPAVAVPWA